MKKQILFVALICWIFISACKNEESSFDKKILVFSKTNGYRHSAIPNGKAAIEKLGKENGFDVDATEDSLAFTEDNLKKYAADQGNEQDLFFHFTDIKFERGTKYKCKK